jgi:arginine decarboxylase
MKITVTYGIGEGPTELAAFDKALFDAGVANYNLIKLSSMIPPGSSVSVGKAKLNDKAHGDKLYVVLAEQRESQPGTEAWAGIGWVIDGKGTKGMFVEHEGHSEAAVKKQIEESLTSMRKYRPDGYGSVQMKIVGTKCKKEPVCALVCAVYKSEGWG